MLPTGAPEVGGCGSEQKGGVDREKTEAGIRDRPIAGAARALITEGRGWARL
jgi:hypothetical protein